MPILLNQKDSRWKSKLLGNGSVTIGGYGCTLTCLCMLAGESDVAAANNRGKLNGLFTGETKNLINWTAVNKTFPNLSFIYRYDYYNNDKVKDAINKYGGCLVCVDAAPICGTQHWVLYVGGGKLYDPFGGVIRSTSYYKALRFTVIGYNKNEETITKPVSNIESQNMIEKLWEKIKGNIKHQADINNLTQNDVDNIANEINTAYKDKENLEIELEKRAIEKLSLAKENGELQEKIEVLDSQLTDLNDDFEASEEVQSGLNNQIKNLKEENERLAIENSLVKKELEENSIYKCSFSALLAEIFARIINRIKGLK